MSVACVGPAWHAFERVGKDGGSLSLAPKFLPLSFQPVVTQAPSPGGGVLPYITYTGMCRPTGSWFWSSWFRTGYPFHRRFLERGIIFRTHESTSFVSSHLKLIIQGQIAFKNTVQCVNKQTVVLLLHPRTEYKKIGPFLERGISFRANSRTGYKKLAHF